MNQTKMNERISKLSTVSGTGSIRMADGSIRDVQVVGIFTYSRWTFIVHQSIWNSSMFDVSEASSGCSIKFCLEETAEDAYYNVRKFLYDKRFHFETSVGNIVVKYGSLLKRNSGIITVAIHSLWIK